MFKYRNVKTGRELERPAADEWLEASSGWEPVEAIPFEAIAADDDNEREDD